MHLPTFAGPHRRTRRAVLAAALPAVIAAVALPTAAHAGTVFFDPDGSDMLYDGGSEANNVVLTRTAPARSLSPIRPA